MANSSSAGLVKGSLEDCIAKALPTQTEMGVQNLATTLRDIGVESPDDIQYVEAADLASVLKPVQIRKLLQQVKADLNQGVAQKMGFSSQSGQSTLVAFQEQGLQSQLPGNLSGMCIQIPTSNISPSLGGIQTISSDKVHDSIITYTEQPNTPTNILHTGSKQYHVNFDLNSDVVNYIPMPGNINQDNSNTDLRAQVSNQLRSNRPYLVEPLQVERDKTTNSKGVSPSLISFNNLPSKNQIEIVDLSPTEITSFDSSLWNLDNTNKSLVSAPIVLSDDSNSSILCESSNSANFENSMEHSVNESLETSQQTEFLTMQSSSNDTLAGENSDWLDKFQIPWNMMPPGLIDRLERHKRPEQCLRREMIRVVIAEMSKLCTRPTRHQLKIIARKMVRDYPEALLDPAENSKDARGCNSILKQLVAGFENINGQFSYQKKLLSCTRTRKSGKFLSNYGCINWQPSKLPANETKWSLRLKQDLLKNISMMQSWDVEQVTNDMISTYFFQRKDINSGTSILTLRKDWPFLFEEIGIMVHFKELTGVDLKVSIKEIINSRARLIIDFMKTVKIAVGQAELNKILKGISKGGFISENQRGSEMAAMVLLIMLFMNEDRNILFPIGPKNYNMSLIKAMKIPETPCLIVCGDSISNSSQFVLCIDKEIVNDKITNFLTGVMMLFASYYCFNIHYPSEGSATLEFMQRCLVGINPANKSGSRQLSLHPQVVNLVTGLEKFGWQVPAELNSCLPSTQESADSSQWSATNATSGDADLTIVCSNQDNFINFSTEKTRDEDQHMSQNSQVLEAERLAGQNANDGDNQMDQQQTQRLSLDPIPIMVPDPPNQNNNELEGLRPNQTPNRPFAGSSWGRGSLSGTSRGRGRGGRGRGNIHRRPKEWMREYWRIKKRESRARQEYWLKRMQNEVVNKMNNDVTSTTVNVRENSQGSRMEPHNLCLDFPNMPSSDGGPSEEATSNTVGPLSVESQAPLPQAQMTLSTPPPPLRLTPPLPEILDIPPPPPPPPPPIYKFEIQQQPNWLVKRFQQMWKRRLLCNAAVGNGSTNIMVHRDVLLASCIKLLQEPNADVFQGNFLQLTFTNNIKEESLWSLCQYIYEGSLIVNANIAEDIENIGQILGIQHIQNLVDKYKQIALSDPHRKTEKDNPHGRMKQELCSEDTGLSSSKPFVKIENVEGSTNLPNSTLTLETTVTLSTVMTGGVSTKRPDYSNRMMVVLEVEPDSLSDKDSPSQSTVLSLDGGRNLTNLMECQQIKHEGV